MSTILIYYIGCQWMLLPLHSDHQSNPKLMNIDGFDTFSMHMYEYNYTRKIKIVWSHPETIRALALLLITNHGSQ